MPLRWHAVTPLPIFSELTNSCKHTAKAANSVLCSSHGTESSGNDYLAPAQLHLASACGWFGEVYYNIQNIKGNISNCSEYSYFVWREHAWTAVPTPRFPTQLRLLSSAATLSIHTTLGPGKFPHIVLFLGRKEQNNAEFICFACS